jgi:hypothetical protein
MFSRLETHMRSLDFLQQEQGREENFAHMSLNFNGPNIEEFAQRMDMEVNRALMGGAT